MSDPDSPPPVLHITVSDGEVTESSSDGVWEESDLVCNTSQDDSFHTIASQPSTPAKKNKGRRATYTPLKEPSTCQPTPPSEPDRFKVPRLPPYKVCSICKRLLKTERGYENHMNMH